MRKLALLFIVLSLASVLARPAGALTGAEEAFRADLFSRINNYRVGQGHAALPNSGSEAAGAQTTADHNRTSCDPGCHRPEGDAHFEIVWWGEGNQATPDAAMTTWINSPPHKANILRDSRAMGVGVAIDPNSSRTWAVVWFDTDPDVDNPTPTTKLQQQTPTTRRQTSTPTTLVTGATTPTTPTSSLVVAETTTSVVDTTTSTTTDDATDATLSLEKTNSDGDDGSALPGILAAAAALGIGGAAFLGFRRRRANAL